MHARICMCVCVCVCVCMCVCPWMHLCTPEYRQVQQAGREPVQSSPWQVNLSDSLKWGWLFILSIHKSPRVHLHVAGMLWFMSDINQLSLPTPLYSVLVYFYLCGPFNCISFHKFPDSFSFSDSVLSSSSLISASLVLSTMSLFMKVSFNPDIIPSGWLGSKHPLTN